MIKIVNKQVKTYVLINNTSYSTVEGNVKYQEKLGGKDIKIGKIGNTKVGRWSEENIYKKLELIIGYKRAEEICIKEGISKRSNLSNLEGNKKEIVLKIINEVKKEKEEKKKRRNNDIYRLIKVGSYRGSRHKLGYPTRGQRTRSNAKTASIIQRKNRKEII